MNMSNPLQLKFRTTNAYKRSKHYLDIRRINRIEHQQQLERRKPKTQITLDTVDLKLQESFISADVKLQSRVRTQIDKQKLRCFKEEDNDDVDTNHSNTACKKSKTLDMSKMLSRDYFQKQTQCSRDQAQFCNFKQYEVPKNHTIDFKKLFNVRSIKKQSKTKKCLKCIKKQKTLQTQSDVNDDLYDDQLGKIYEKLIFDESAFRTLIDFKKSNKETTKIANPQIQKDEQRIKLGQKMTKKYNNLGYSQFYHGKNKWNAHQMDNKVLKQNQFFLAYYNKKSEKVIDWSIIKRKVDLIQQRRVEIINRKNIPDIKGEICDELYFRRNFIDQK